MYRRKIRRKIRTVANRGFKILAGLAAHSGQISVGLGQGFSAILIPQLLEKHFADTSETSWIASLGVVSNPLGSLIAGLCAEWFGRRSAIALASLPHAAGWLLIALSTNVPMLYVGRFISGIGMGMANGLYLYVSETAAPNQRAWLGSCGPVLVSLGVLMIYTLGAFTTWEKAAAISIGPAILSLALTRMIPETPGWLMARGRNEEAKESLLWLRGPGSTTDKEYEELCNSNLKRQESKESLTKALHMPSVWKPFLILLVFFALQQMSGIYIILFYAVTVLEDIDINDLNEYTASVGIGMIRLIASIVGAGLANSFGRKVLAFISGLGMAVSAVGVALTFRFKLPSTVSLVCIGGHVGSSMIGFLTLPWVMTSELYPLRFRGPLGGITTSLAQLLTFGTIKLYPDLRYMAGIEVIMWTFAGASILGTLFAIIILPETRGRSLDQIESNFSSKSEWNSTSQTLPTISAQSRNISLEKFASLSEEKQPHKISNAYAYDNLFLDLSHDDDGKSTKNSISDSDAKCNNAHTISLQHVYI
ncbi:facilitated trehalose transporter Tret1 isoform X3 [Nomia melanderi]|uniref:facilitated trehalose transporter Tret1 isoform X3 n=1 Tax=Nomia melanderi TaxID=2448451 RepID=UPI001304703B|nr:facilitated trehalose transporter Tret1-like isoform X3 [Nomia melanderi]